jgi:A/G-specific adenine glycosylase
MESFDSFTRPKCDRNLENEPTPLEPKQVSWFRRRLRDWARQNLRDFLWRQTQQPYPILIAEILLQQTRAESVATSYQLFMEKFPDLISLANASVEEIATAIAPLGLKFRAVRLKKMAQLLLEPLYSQQIPHSEAALLQLPGVGRYTANAILAGAFNRLAAVLDTNVARILERYFGLLGGRIKSRDEMLWQLAQQVAPKTDVKTWNWTLIDFGAAICTAQKPLCPSCPLKRRCEYYSRSSPGGTLVPATRKDKLG